MASTSTDPFDDLLNLEDNLYQQGYAQGVADGERAGRVEGRSLGIEKGFAKFVEAGRLYGKAVVWANRLPSSSSSSSSSSNQLPVLSAGGARLEKNIIMLHGLVEPDTLSTENSDEAVNDFDDRVKRAQGRARVVERQVGEEGSVVERKKEGMVGAAAAGVAEGPKRESPPVEDSSRAQEGTIF